MADDFWERRWSGDRGRDYLPYLAPYYRLTCPELDLFRTWGIHTVCDAGCGFGTWTLAFASNGFAVTGLDVSETAVRLTKRLLARYGYTVDVRAASVLNTGCSDRSFDGTVSWSVLDHMTARDAQAALRELARITRPGGLILLAFDSPDADDLALPHTVLDDGSILYTAPPRQGMVFRPYDAAGLERLLSGRSVLYRGTGPKDEAVVILQN